MSQNTFTFSIEFIGICFAIYFIYANSIYSLLLMASVKAIYRDIRLKPLQKIIKSQGFYLSPPISIIAPAFNEGNSIIESTRSFLSLDYPRHEVVVVNDGSSDDTLEKLIKNFSLYESVLPYNSSLSQTEILKVYKSKVHPHLVVVDKKNGGKADALNVGIGYSNFGLFCAVDSDSILDEGSLFDVAMPFIENYSKVVASGGTIRVANGSDISAGRVVKHRLPTQTLALIQVVEYLRAFLCGRVGWNSLNCTLIISGAFGVFKKAAVVEVGGYREKSLGEDFELIMRLHLHMREAKRDYSIQFVPDPVCWTEAPSSLRVLRRQRERWHRGLAETILPQKNKMFQSKYGTIGWIGIPYFIMVELFGPVIELLSYIYLMVCFQTGHFNESAFLIVAILGVGFNLFVSLVVAIIEQVFYSKYASVKNLLLLYWAGLLENFGYRQLNAYWRFVALFKHFAGTKGIWGKMERKGFQNS